LWRGLQPAGFGRGTVTRPVIKTRRLEPALLKPSFVRLKKSATEMGRAKFAAKVSGQEVFLPSEAREKGSAEFSLAANSLDGLG
jgi:hypothetical protein